MSIPPVVDRIMRGDIAVPEDSIARMTVAQARGAIGQAACITYDIDPRHVTFEFDPEQSRAKMIANVTGTDGEDGRYLGEVWFPYQKVDLNEIYSHVPSTDVGGDKTLFVLQMPYRVSFRVFSETIYRAIGLNLEPEDVSIRIVERHFGNEAVGAIDVPFEHWEDLLDFTQTGESTVQNALDVDRRFIQIDTKVTSTRFALNGKIRFLLEALDQPRPIGDVILPRRMASSGTSSYVVPPVLRELTSSTQDRWEYPSDAPSAYVSTMSEIISDWNTRMTGLTVDPAYLELSDATFTGDPSPTQSGNLTITTDGVLEDGSLNRYIGTRDIVFRRMDLSEVVQRPIYLRTTDVVSFDEFVNRLYGTHAIRFFDHEVYITVGPNQSPLLLDDVIELGNHTGPAFLVAADHPRNFRWITGTQFPLYFIAA